MSYQTELESLAYRLADEAVRLRITMLANTRDDDKWWLNTTPRRFTVAEAELRYLELRGLLERHPTRPELVRVRTQN